MLVRSRDLYSAEGIRGASGRALPRSQGNRCKDLPHSPVHPAPSSCLALPSCTWPDTVAQQPSIPISEPASLLQLSALPRGPLRLSQRWLQLLLGVCGSDVHASLISHVCRMGRAGKAPGVTFTGDMAVSVTDKVPASPNQHPGQQPELLLCGEEPAGMWLLSSQNHSELLEQTECECRGRARV